MASTSLPKDAEEELEATPEKVVAPPTSSLFESHSHVFNTAMAFVRSMTFKCAVDLGIPEALQRKGGCPVTIQELAAELAIPPARTECLSRLMRVLEHEGYFARSRTTASGASANEGYVLTPVSAHLIGRGNPPVTTLLIASVMTPYMCLGAWFRDASNQRVQQSTPFHAASGMAIWEYAGRHPEMNEAFNAGISHDAELIAAEVVAKCGHVLGGARSLVDVGGGNGALARAVVSEAFPHLDCTVLELPHVVAEQLARPTTETDQRVAYVAGDMFEYIPRADVLLLKYILHCYQDEECIKILRQCKKAIPPKGGGGEVMIVEVVMKFAVDASEMVVQNQLMMDMVMMTLTGGKERTEEEWAAIFAEAGFAGGYKMTPILDDFLCLIEVFP